MSQAADDISRFRKLVERIPEMHNAQFYWVSLLLSFCMKHVWYQLICIIWFLITFHKWEISIYCTENLSCADCTIQHHSNGAAQDIVAAYRSGERSEASLPRGNSEIEFLFVHPVGTFSYVQNSLESVDVTLFKSVNVSLLLIFLLFSGSVKACSYDVPWECTDSVTKNC